MPLQWLPLRERQPQGRSPISEALTPKRGVTGATDSRYAPGFVEREKARWAEEDKLRKAERDAKVKEAQEMGMRIQAAHKEEQAKGRQMSMQALMGKQTGAPAGTAPALTKENMPEVAKTMWEFISTLDEAGQKFFIQQLKEKEQPTGGFIEAGGVRKEMPGSVGMYGYLVDQGLLDPATDTVIKKEAEPMKGRFDVNTKTGEVFDTTTGKVMGTTKEPENVVDAINKQANADALALQKVNPDIKFEDAKHDALLDYGVEEEVAVDMAKVKEIPKEFKEKDLFGKVIDWIKNLGKEQPPVPGYEVPITGAAKPTFNEVNVNSLVDIISDDVSTAERAHLKGQGASDSDIDEAIKRKRK